MKKTLFLMRHAEAASPAGTRDFDRPLTALGEAMAKDVGGILVARGYGVQKIISSPALRTRTTGELVASAFSSALILETETNFYGAMPDQVIATIRAQPDDLQNLMIVGHNPWIHALAIGMPAAGEVGKMPQIKAMYPPSSCAVLTFDGGWQDSGKAKGELIDFFFSLGRF